MAFDLRHRFLIDKVQEAFKVIPLATIEQFVSNQRNRSRIDAFFNGEGAPKIIVYALPEGLSPEFALAASSSAANGSAGAAADGTTSIQTGPVNSSWILQLSVSENVSLRSKCIFFLRAKVDKPIPAKEADIVQDLLTGIIDANAPASMQNLLTEIFIPLLKSRKDWGKNSEAQQRECLSTIETFANTLAELVQNQHPIVELRKPDPKYLRGLENNPQSFKNASNDENIKAHFECMYRCFPFPSAFFFLLLLLLLLF